MSQASVIVTLTLLSPVSISARAEGGNFVTTRDHIPGRTLRGAVATASIQAGMSVDCEDFQTYFQDGRVQWCTLWPLPEGLEVDGTDSCPLPMPHTTHRCKLYPEDHDLTDLLINSREDVPSCTHRISDRVCGKGLARAKGTLFQSGGIWRGQADRTQRSHVSIWPMKGSARPNYLFTREALKPGLRLRGRILCPSSDVADGLVALVAREPLAVGGARSRGYGQVSVAAHRSDLECLDAEEVVAFSQHALQRLGRDPAEQTTLFSLGAASPLWLRNWSGGDARSLSLEHVAQALQLPSDAVTLLNGRGHTEEVVAWDSVVGLPVERRTLISAGSVTLVEVSGAAPQKLSPALARLAADGIGAGRGEGLGQVIINHPIHLMGESHAKCR